MRRAVATSAFHALLRSPMRPTAATATAAALSRRPLLATSSFSAFTTNASNAVSRSKRPADAKKGMQIAFFSAHQYDIDSMTSIAQKEGIADDHELLYVRVVAFLSECGLALRDILNKRTHDGSYIYLSCVYLQLL